MQSEHRIIPLYCELLLSPNYRNRQSRNSWAAFSTFFHVHWENTFTSLPAAVCHVHTHACSLFLGWFVRVDLITLEDGKCLSIGTYRSFVRLQKVFPISMKFGMWIEVDDWCMTVCRMTWSRVKVKVTGASEVPKIALFQLFLFRHLQWELANDH